jgi:hypothetical protein
MRTSVNFPVVDRAANGEVAELVVNFKNAELVAHLEDAQRAVNFEDVEQLQFSKMLHALQKILHIAFALLNALHISKRLCVVHFEDVEHTAHIE